MFTPLRSLEITVVRIEECENEFRRLKMPRHADAMKEARLIIKRQINLLLIEKEKAKPETKTDVCINASTTK